MGVEAGKAGACSDISPGGGGPGEVYVAPGVFAPTRTSTLIASAAAREGGGARRTLDLGCGCGYVGLTLAQCGLVAEPLAASDISPEAVACCRLNAERLGVACDARAGSLFECWAGERFDLIVESVSGVAEGLARNSRWFPEFAPCGAGADGATLVTRVLEEAPDHLSPGGHLVFPVLSLSDEGRILAKAGEAFAEVTRIGQEFYPVSEEVGAGTELLEELMSAGHIRLRRVAGAWVWWSSVYRATLPRRNSRRA